jgi:H+/Cl- antiporter ClcA
MTDGRAMAIPLMAASLIAYGASRLVTREPIYHALSKRYVRTVTARHSSAG